MKKILFIFVLIFLTALSNRIFAGIEYSYGLLTDFQGASYNRMSLELNTSNNSGKGYQGLRVDYGTYPYFNQSRGNGPGSGASMKSWFLNETNGAGNSTLSGYILEGIGFPITNGWGKNPFEFGAGFNFFILKAEWTFFQVGPYRYSGVLYLGAVINTGMFGIF